MENEEPKGAVWQLELFGGLRLVCETPDGVVGKSSLTTVALPRLRKAQALLALLALIEPGETLSREEIAEHLWPGDPLEETRDRLRQTLYVLRRVFDPISVFEVDRLSIGFRAEAIRSDISTFTRELRAAAAAERSGDHARRIECLGQALSVYRGDLLPGFYEDYFLARRAALAEQRVEALIALTELTLRTGGDLQVAVHAARDAVAADPLREEGHAALLRCYAAQERPGEITRHFRETENVFRRDMDCEPSAALRALVVSLVEAATTPTAPSVVLTSDSLRVLPVSGPSGSGHPPQRLTRFFGRETEISKLSELLFGRDSCHFPDSVMRVRTPRLVTLTGPGGTGKTRLAVETARRRLDYETVFVPLSEVRESGGISIALAEALDLTANSAEVLLKKAAVAIAGRIQERLSTASGSGLLLILDNFEQIADGGAGQIIALLEEFAQSNGDGAGLAILVTSRQRLEVSGEQEFPVEPLPTPRSAGTPERLSEFASVQLFADRARAVRNAFAITSINAGDVAELCRRLDGLPLAIELAAAWSSVLTPAQMLARLNRRFDLLISRRSDVPVRHGSLRAVIESNLSLQSLELRRLFVRLSIFRSGWTLEAAEAICAESDEDVPSILASLSELERRSLIVSGVNDTGDQRFHMLESLRAYGQELFHAEMIAYHHAISRKYAVYFSELVEVHSRAIQDDAGASVGLKAIDADMDNVRAAIAWLLENDAVNALWLTSRLWRYCEVRGMMRECVAYMEAALQASASWTDLSVAQREARAGALAGLANMLVEEGQSERPEALYEESMQIWRSLDRSVDVAIGLSNLALIDRTAGRYDQGRARCEEALEIFRRTGNAPREAICLTCLGTIATQQKDFDFARRCHEESLALKRAFGNPLAISNSLNCLGHNALTARDTVAARHYCGEALKIRREQGDLQGTASALDNIAECELLDGNLYRARDLYCEELALDWKIGRIRHSINTVESLSLVAFRLGELSLSLGLLAGAGALRRRHRLFSELYGPHLPSLQSLEQDLQSALTANVYAWEWQVAETLADGQIVALALGNRVAIPALRE